MLDRLLVSSGSYFRRFTRCVFGHSEGHVVLTSLVSSSLRCLHPGAWRRRPSAPLSGENAGVSTPVCHLLPPPRPPPPLPLSVASSKDALSSSWTPGVTPVEKQEGKEGGGERTWLEGRKIISARLLCLRLKPDLHFKSSGRSCCHLRDAIDQPACHLMSAGTGALMKLIEQPMIDNGTARQRHCHGLSPFLLTFPPWIQATTTAAQDPIRGSTFSQISTSKCFWLP